jgi:carboxyl-terminal processing protease
MPRMSASFRSVVALAAGMLLGFGVSVGPAVKAERTAPERANAKTATALPFEDAELFAEVLERIRAEYVDEVSQQKLIEAAIRGMLSDLDPHSAYLDRAQFDEVRISTSGEYSGVGIEVTLQRGSVRVVTPIEGTPAERAGIKAGDRILAIDRVPVDPERLDDAIDRMRGVVGTSVTLEIERDGVAEPLEFHLKRESVQVQSVRKALLPGRVGYVRISQFSERTPRAVERAIESLRKEAGTLDGLVLDLRNNPGGVLEAAVGVADLFLDEGLIVSAVGRAADAEFAMEAAPGDVMAGAPIVVLVNAGSASASEIVAGALRDHRRATLVGQKTYGKGSVQTIMPLSNGQALKLTTSRYFTPSGESIHNKGIVPDRTIATEELEAAHGAESALYGSLAHDYELRVALDVLAGAAVQQSRLH